MFSIDQIDHLWKNFDAEVINFRYKYFPIYTVIENYLSLHTSENISGYGDTRIFLGGTMSVSLLLNKKRTKDDFTYVLYTETAFNHANDLTNIIAKTIDEIYSDVEPDKNNPKWVVSLKTVDPGNKYYISVDYSTIVTIIRMNNADKKVNIYNLMKPIDINTYMNKKVLVVPPRFHLIELYRTLYSPGKAAEWELSMVDEARLFKYLKNRYGVIKTLGGDDLLDDVRKNIINKFVKNNPNIILLGEYAIGLLSGEESNVKVISVISQIDMKSLQIEISQIVNDATGKITPLSYVKNDLYIINDFRLSKYTIKMGGEHDQTSIMYIYNTAEYELVPFNIINVNDDWVQIGNPFVLLRFLLIDLWVISWIAAISTLEKSYVKTRVSTIMYNVIKLRQKLSKKKTNKILNKFISNKCRYQIFQSNVHEYIGMYEDEIIAQKINVQSTAQKFYRDYYPQLYIKTFGKYREL